VIYRTGMILYPALWWKPGFVVTERQKIDNPALRGACRERERIRLIVSPFSVAFVTHIEP